jgi:hypothetical protein
MSELLRLLARDRPAGRMPSGCRPSGKALLDRKPMQARIFDAMSGEQRVLMVFQASHYIHELAKQRIRDEHPDWPEDKVTREWKPGHVIHVARMRRGNCLRRSQCTACRPPGT